MNKFIDLTINNLDVSLQKFELSIVIVVSNESLKFVNYPLK